MDMGSMDMSSSATSTMMSMAASVTSAAMSMASSTAASHTMNMASHTMNMASHTMDMSSPTSTGHSMEHMEHMGMSMNMYLTRSYAGYPVVFKSLYANSKAQAFGIFVLIFFVGFFLRGLEFLRNYLEQRVWHNPSYVGCEPVARVDAVRSCCDGASDEKADDSVPTSVAAPNKSAISVALGMFRDCIRLFLCVVPEMFNYALMLAAMTFCLTYFFAVVVGLGVGRFVFEKLLDNMRLRAVNGLGTSHC